MAGSKHEGEHTSNKGMPLVGLGTWKLENEDAAATVERAIKAGYRLIDCASDYGNEIEVGKGIRGALQSVKDLKREDLFVTSKLWNTFHRFENVELACKKTLSDLGLEYLDLYLIHFPISLKFVPIEERYPPSWGPPTDQFPLPIEIEDVTIRETWEAMEKLVEKKLVRRIGVANFSCALLMDLLKYAKIKPAVNQIEFHPDFQQNTLVRFCQTRDIEITGYSSFGGLSYVAFNQVAKNTPSLLKDPIIHEIAQRYHKTNAQVILRFAVQQRIAVIPKSSHEQRLKENLNIFDFILEKEEIEKIQSLEKNIRYNNPAVYCNYPIFD